MTTLLTRVDRHSQCFHSSSDYT